MARAGEPICLKALVDSSCCAFFPYDAAFDHVSTTARGDGDVEVEVATTRSSWMKIKDGTKAKQVNVHGRNRKEWSNG